MHGRLSEQLDHSRPSAFGFSIAMPSRWYQDWGWPPYAQSTGDIIFQEAMRQPWRLTWIDGEPKDGVLQSLRWNPAFNPDREDNKPPIVIGKYRGEDLTRSYNDMVHVRESTQVVRGVPLPLSASTVWDRVSRKALKLVVLLHFLGGTLPATAGACWCYCKGGIPPPSFNVSSATTVFRVAAAAAAAVV